jgi:hypothetical protein
MSKDPGYPDDIRQYDNDPRSPFYVDPNEWMIEASDNLALDWAEELEKTDFIDALDMTRDELIAELKARPTFDQLELLAEKAYALVEANPENYMPCPPEGY